MKHLYFVRHGLSVMNQRGVFSGRTETPLTDEGVEQAKRAGQELRSAGIEIIVASPIKRAHDTAILIAQELGIDPSKILLNESFVERSFGPLEGTPYRTDIDFDSMPGVEHSDELLRRSAEGVAYLESLPADTILVVAHGAIGRALRSLVQPDTPFHGSERFENAQVVKIV
jgi:uncharacterized phosphatase